MARRAGVATWRSVRKGARALLDIALPPVCPLTDEMVDAPGRLSPQAWAQVVFLTPPWCARCGQPFGCDPGGDSLCAACRANPPVFDRARAGVAYDDASRMLILDLKHAARGDVVATLAGWALAAGRELLDEADLLIPVPLHASRLAKRGFNQAGLLARALAERTRGRFDADALVRARATPSQGGLSAHEREDNVAGAFAVRPSARARIARARVVLVDDVYTTGATLSACARTLKKAGAARVDAVAAARVVRPRDALV